MGYERGRFGVEYQPRRSAETHRLRALALGIVLIVLVVFTWYRVTHRRAAPPEPTETPSLVPPPPAPRETARPAVPAPTKKRATPESSAVAAPKSPPAAPRLSEAARRAAALAEASTARSEKERVLLQRWAEAERQGNVALAIDALRKLYERPTMADVRDTLMRRLGELNLRHLFSGQTTPWTVIVKAKRGDSRDRIAREHRSTPAVVARLNPDMKWERLRPGDAVRVLDFPSAVLVIDTQRGCADLSLKNGQFFRRYVVSAPKTTPAGVYPIAPETGATVHTRFKELGVKMTAADRAEIEMFLAPGSRITVVSP